MSEVIAIAAMAENRVIGFENRMPWHLSCDLKRFKALTLGCPVVMGRNTFESLGRKPLPGRRNMVVSRFAQEGVETFTSLSAALEACATTTATAATSATSAYIGRIFIIGGAQLYAAAFAAGVVTRIELTRVFLSPQGDTFFPPFEENFELVAQEDVSEKGTECRFETWLPKRSS